MISGLGDSIGVVGVKKPKLPGIPMQELPLALALVRPVAELETLLAPNFFGRRRAGEKKRLDQFWMVVRVLYNDFRAL